MATLRRLRLRHAAAAAVALCGLVASVSAAGDDGTSRPTAASGTILAAAAPPSSAPRLPTGFQESIAFSGLVQPTAVRFARDGRVFVAEKRGEIWVYDSLTDTTPTLFADLRTEVYNYWDRGLTGLELDPNFPASPYVYVMYTLDAPPGEQAPYWHDACPTPPGATTDGCVAAGQLSRLTASGDVMTGSEQVILSGWCQQFPSHTTDDLHFGPDGALYASSGDGATWTTVDYGQWGSAFPGDAANPCGDPPAGAGGTQTPPTAEGGTLRSQSLYRADGPADLNGALLRLDPATGAAPPDNPLAASADPIARRIVAAGLRNPFRFAFRPGTSEVWIADVGMNRFEEVDRDLSPTAGVPNFGWPCYEGTPTQPLYAALGLDACNRLYATGDTGPYYTYSHPSPVVAGDGCQMTGTSITAIGFYAGGSYPKAYDGALFFGDHSRQCIWVMYPGANGLPDPKTVVPFVSPAVGPVDIETGPGGDLFYVAINDGTIRRIRYFPGNQPPVAQATATTPTSGAAPLTVSFDGSGSSDPDPGDTITYSWDLDGDGVYGDSTAVAPTWKYTQAGTYSASLRVTDNHGATTTSTPVVVTVDNTPPTPVIDTPDASLTWRVGDPISFTGHATDAQDGSEPPASLTWTVILHHCPSGCHTHFVQTFTGATGSFPAPDHDYPSYLELQLTATDSGGLGASTSVILQPKTVALTFRSVPTGLQLVFGTFSGTTPFTHTVIVHSQNTLTAPDQMLGSSVDDFSAWSDGGAQTHAVTAPDHPRTFIATFAKHGAPIAVAGATPAGGKVPLTVQFDASRSSSPAGYPLTYAWDLDGDGAVDSTAKAPTWAYTAPNAVTVTLTVSDGHGGSASRSLSIRPRVR